MRAIRTVFGRYFSMHGPLLAKGLSFSALFAAIPLLFFFTLAGSVFLTEEVRSILETQLLVGIPDAYRRSLMISLDRFAQRPGSLSLASAIVFLFSVHTLFFDVHRVVRAGLGLEVRPGRGRLRALLLNAVFLLLIYSAAVLTLLAQIGSSYLPASGPLLHLSARLSAIVILAVALGSIIRVSGGIAIPLRTGVPVFLTAAVVWETATFLSGFIVRGASRRVVIYGILASAVMLLFLMRIFAEILLQTALWLHYFLHRREEEPSSTSVVVKDS